MDLPLISIIVPVYKVEPFLRRCVDSILSQTYSNIELILVDDGSPDECPAICDEYAVKDSRVFVIHQHNTGVSAARNAGLDAFKGNLVGFVDSDDWIEPDMLEVLYEVIAASKSDVSMLSFCGDSDVPEKVDIEAYDILSKMEAIKKMLLGQYNLATVWGKLYNASIFANVRFPVNITNGEDSLFILKVIENSNNVSFINYKGYHYYSNPNSATHIYRESSWSEQKASDLIINAVKNLPDPIVDAAKLRSIRRDITLAILVCDSGEFSHSAYNRVFSHINQYKEVKSLLQMDYKCWCILLSFGRLPFIIGRKVFNFLRKD